MRAQVVKARLGWLSVPLGSRSVWVCKTIGIVEQGSVVRFGCDRTVLHSAQAPRSSTTARKKLLRDKQE